MKNLGLAVLVMIIGYIVGLFGGMGLMEALSSNTHDRSLEAAMTGAFVIGPLAAFIAVGVFWYYVSTGPTKAVPQDQK